MLWTALALAAASRLAAQVSIPISGIIYDNSNVGGTNYYSSTTEYGDEVVLIPHPPGQLWVVTDFQLEYFGDFTPTGKERGRLRLYLNDGPPTSYPPSTMLYDSGEFPLDVGYQKTTFSGLNVTVADDPADKTYPHLTWTAQFTGVRGLPGNRAGLVLRQKADIGFNFNDFWSRNAFGWSLQQLVPPFPNLPPDPVTNPTEIANFGARIWAIPQNLVPVGKLNLRREGKNLVLNWSSTARLQNAPNSSGPYTDVANAKSPHTVPLESASSPLGFWRLVR